MIKIPLTQDKVAIIDDEDYKRVSQYKWSYHNQGYAQTNGGWTLMHRFILNARDGQQVDHINGDRLDNRRENLRFVTNSQQHINRSKPAFVNRTSNYKGVSLRSNGRWQVMLQRRYVGTFLTEEEAARAYDKRAKELFGEFARLNFPEV